MGRLGRRFLADPATRTISPFSKITVPQYIENRIKENTAESLAEAERLAYGNVELLERIGKAQAALMSAKGGTADGIGRNISRQEDCETGNWQPGGKGAEGRKAKSLGQNYGEDGWISGGRGCESVG